MNTGMNLFYRIATLEGEKGPGVKVDALCDNKGETPIIANDKGCAIDQPINHRLNVRGER